MGKPTNKRSYNCKNKKQKDAKIDTFERNARSRNQCHEGLSSPMEMSPQQPRKKNNKRKGVELPKTSVDRVNNNATLCKINSTEINESQKEQPVQPSNSDGKNQTNDLNFDSYLLSDAVKLTVNDD